MNHVPLVALADAYTRWKYSSFVSPDARKIFGNWLLSFSVPFDSLHHNPNDGVLRRWVRSSDHESGVGASWTEEGGIIYGISAFNDSYAIPVKELASMPAIPLVDG